MVYLFENNGLSYSGVGYYAKSCERNLRELSIYFDKQRRNIGERITGAVVDLRLVISIALKIAATGIILCNNHPSFNLTPSPEDLAITLKIKEACRLFDIQVKDHIILSPERKFLSMAEEGDMITMSNLPLYIFIALIALTWLIIHCVMLGGIYIIPP